ncbi:MAG: hypothetical protein ACJ746_03355 [Bryobacteraceae bacterium]
MDASFHVGSIIPRWAPLSSDLLRASAVPLEGIRRVDSEGDRPLLPDTDACNASFELVTFDGGDATWPSNAQTVELAQLQSIRQD